MERGAGRPVDSGYGICSLYEKHQGISRSEVGPDRREEERDMALTSESLEASAEFGCSASWSDGHHLYPDESGPRGILPDWLWERMSLRKSWRTLGRSIT